MADETLSYRPPKTRQAGSWGLWPLISSYLCLLPALAVFVIVLNYGTASRWIDGLRPIYTAHSIARIANVAGMILGFIAIFSRFKRAAAIAGLLNLVVWLSTTNVGIVE